MMNSAEAACQNRRDVLPSLATNQHDNVVARLAAIAASASIGIDVNSGLASDFLNQFNEVSMLLDMAGDDVELLEELNDWTPRGYAEHFEASNFRDSALVLEAYSLSPVDTRARFDRLSDELGSLIRNGLESIHATPAAVETASQALAADVRARIETLSAIIHPTERTPNSDDISAMFAARR